MGDSDNESVTSVVLTESAALKRLKKERANCKMKLTIYKKFIASLDMKRLGADTKSEIRLRTERINLTFNDFDKVQNQIVTWSDNLDEELIERENFEKTYYELISKVGQLVDPIETKHNRCSAKAHEETCASGSIKYPEIPLPTFSGDIGEWLEFRDTFNATVNQGALQPIQKYKYLRTCLKGSALEVIGALEYNEESYDLAWQLLCERFNNPKALVHNHLDGLFQISEIQNNASALRCLVDSISKHTRTLKNMNLPVDQWDTIIIYFISTKLGRLRIKWEEKTASSKELPTLQEFKQFLKSRADILETTAKQPGLHEGGTAPAKEWVKPHNKVTTSISYQCPLCKSNHYLHQCNKFLALDINTRNKTVHRLRICANCLKGTHNIATCKGGACRTCRGKHNTLLHNTSYRYRPTTLQVQPNMEEQLGPHSSATVINTASCRLADSSENIVVQQPVLLSTAEVLVKDNKNKQHTMRVLLDTGAQANFISKGAYQKLNIPSHNINMEVAGFAGGLTNIEHYCNIKLYSKHSSYTTEIPCLIAPTICTLPTQVINHKLFTIPKQYKLADKQFHTPGLIDMIIGVELFYKILCAGQYNLGTGMPIMQNTKLGWIIAGAVNKPAHPRISCNFILTQNNFWDNDLGTKGTTDSELSYCEATFKQHSRAKDGSFIVKLPLKLPLSSLGNSRNIAYCRQITLEKKFQKNPTYKKLYIQFMRDFEATGKMTEITKTNIQPMLYLPHMAVLNPEKISTPLRVVIDASCPSSSGVSLNDLQYKGELLQPDLFDIVIKFRMYTYVISADVERMYTQILVHEDQRELQCILWRERPTERLKTYVLQSLSFGLRAAPYLATRCLLELSNENKNKFPAAAQAIANNFLMDDLLYGGDDKAEVITTVQQITAILRTANFHLRKWKSNSDAILETVSNNTHTHSNHNTTVDIGNPSQKILGLAWANKSDELLYTIEKKPVPKSLTKRIALSQAASIYDPLGLLGPTIIIAKFFIKKLVELKISWDEPLNKDLTNEWIGITTEITNINNLKIPRHVKINNATYLELHGFSDSSKKAYGAAIYVRSANAEGKISVKILCAKSRLAKVETMPRLELQAALLLARLLHKVKNIIRQELGKVCLWTDSTIVLAWIHAAPQNLNIYVANRVKEIQKLTKVENWHWVSSGDNPSDLLSRGCAPRKLVNNTLWWNGPEWLSKTHTRWPVHASALDTLSTPSLETKPEKQCNSIISDTDVDIIQSSVDTLSTPLLEMKPKKQCNIIISDTDVDIIQSIVDKFEKETKIIRTYAYVRRFIYNLKSHTKIKGNLSLAELNDALYSIIRYTQLKSYYKEYKELNSNKPVHSQSKIAGLDPFIEDGLIKVGGRLKLSHFPSSKKHPIILPHNEKFTKVILRDLHEKLLHTGPQQLLAVARERYWPINGKCLANKVVRHCIQCFRAKPTTTSPIMGNLPMERCTPSLPFTTTGIDYAGPFMIRDRRRRGYKTYKCWVALFVCFSTKAVHIELISGLESRAFLAALRRFISRRGKPAQIVSDNGTTFHGANNEIKELYQYMKYNPDIFTDYASNEGIVWKFNPVYTPHMGGLTEAAVRSCKLHLKRILGNALLTYEEFSTVLTQIEGILNSRPLCPLPNSNNDSFPILTPAHFLIGRSLTSLPDYDLADIAPNKLTLFRQLQQLYQNFWRRWSSEYIGLLQQRLKWRRSKGQTLKPGTIVIVRDTRSPPCHWSLGKIEHAHPGADDVNRVATIKTSKGLIKRAFNNICPLPLDPMTDKSTGVTPSTVQRA